MDFNKFALQRENKQRGEADFPIELHLVDKLHQRYLMPLHWHTEIEIISVQTGILNLFVNNIPYSLCTGDIAIVNSKQLHRAVPENCVYKCIVLDLEALLAKNSVYNTYLLPIINGNIKINTLFAQDSSRVFYNLNALFKILETKHKHWKLSVVSTLFAIFEALYSENSISTVSTTKKLNTQTKIIAELLTWIDIHYAQFIDLETLSKISGFSKNYLCRIFKSYTKETPMEYINSVRIHNVCNQLKAGHKSITEIALDNGYNDISYFCRVFKKHMGISAKAYAKEIKQAAL